MRLSASQNLLDRRAAADSTSLSAHQLRLDAAWAEAQSVAGDWRMASLALLAPLAVSRLPGLWRSAAGLSKLGSLGEASLIEAGGQVLAGSSAWAKWTRFGGALGLSGTLAACSGDPARTDMDAGLQPPRSMEAQGAEYAAMAAPSTGTNQGFAASLNEAGQLAVAWADFNPSGPNPSVVYSRLFSAAGAGGSAVEVGRPAGAVALSPSVSNTDRGDVLVAWTESMGPDAPSGIRARRLDSSGQAQGEAFTAVPIENHNPPILGSIALSDDASFIVVSNENSADCGVCARRYGADNVQRSVTTLSEPGASVLASDLSSSSQGDWAWAGMVARADGQREIRFRYFDLAQGFGAPGSFTIPDPGTGTRIQVAILPGNRSLLVWQSAQGLRGMLFTPDGRTQGSPIELNSLPPGASFSATSDETGAFVVAWEEAGQVRASLLASDGRMIARDLSVSDGGSENHEVTVAANEHGGVSIVWRRFLQSPAGYQLMAKNYQIRY